MFKKEALTKNIKEPRKPFKALKAKNSWKAEGFHENPPGGLFGEDHKRKNLKGKPFFANNLKYFYALKGLLIF
jgi:hypothetical protein